MDSKTFSIGILSVTAVILLVAQFVRIEPAAANTAVRDRDYTLVTANAVSGGNVVYVIENRTGLVAAFTWDGSRRNLQVRGVTSVSDAFK